MAGDAAHLGGRWLGDVARVEDGLEDERSYAQFNGRPGVSLEVRRQSGRNTLEVAEAVHTEVERLQAVAPDGYELVVARDVIILGGAGAFALVVGRLRGEPSVLSKANTFFQLLFLVLTICHAGFGWVDQDQLVLLGAAVVFTSVTSGVGYVFSWSTRAMVARRAKA